MQFTQVAKKQLHSMIMDEVYKEYKFGEICLRNKDKAQDFATSATNIYKKIAGMKEQLGHLTEADWTANFAQRCEVLLKEREQEWDSSWKQKCSGKQFFKDLNQYAGGFGLDGLLLKKRLMAGNKEAEDSGTESWKLLRATLQDLIDKK